MPPAALRRRRRTEIRTVATPQAFGAREAEAFVKRVRVARAQKQGAVLQHRMRDDAFHHPLAHSTLPVLRRDNDITNPGKGGVVGHGAGEPDLLSAMKQSEAKRVANGTLDDFARTFLSPVGWPQ